MVERHMRMLLFVMYLITWGFVQHYFGVSIIDGEVYQIVLLTLVLTLAVLVLFVEHFFTKPSDALTSSIAVLLLLAPLKGELGKLGWLYSASITYSLLIASVAFLSLFFLNDQSPQNWRNRFASGLSWIATNFGHSRILFALPFLSIAANYSNNKIEEWGAWIFLYAVVALLPLESMSKKLATLWLNRKSDEKNIGVVGAIVSVHADNVYRARRYKDSSAKLRLFDKIHYRFDHGSESEAGEGLVISKYVSEEEDTFKFIKTSSIPIPAIANRQVRITVEDNQTDAAIAGLVTHGTEISLLRFEYLPKLELTEGDILYTDSLQGQRVFYQIINAMNLIEAIDSKSENGRIIGYATQVGVYDKETQTFDKYGWVPPLNSLLYKAKSESVDLGNKRSDEELLIGYMKGLEAPLLVNAEELVTHHTAILGVTGRGKSVFARQLIKDVSEKRIKVICIDFTNEHETKLKAKGLSVRKIIDEKVKSRELNPKIEDWAAEMAKYPDKRTKGTLDTLEREIMVLLGGVVIDFAKSTDEVAIVDLPDFTSTNATLEFTKWFMRGLFKVARDAELQDAHGNIQKVAVVIEEAHTIIPEWNFGDQQQSTKAAINAISQVALQGRKYGVGFIVIAQRTASVSKTVLTQCNTIIAFKQFDKTSCDFLSNYLGDSLARTLPNLGFRQAIAAGKAVKGNVPVIFTVPEILEESPVEDKPTTRRARSLARDEPAGIADRFPKAEPYKE